MTQFSRYVPNFPALFRFSVFSEWSWIFYNEVVSVDNDNYERIRSGGAGFYEQKRGLISVRGKEAVQFLDGMVTSDMKTLEPGEQTIAAFPNAQGRLLAVVRIRRFEDGFFVETEATTREKVFQNLFRFTFAGDFLVADISDNFDYFELFDCSTRLMPAMGMSFTSPFSIGRFEERRADFGLREELLKDGAVAIDDDLYETLRIENGVPKYGVDMDETTIVPELGLDGLISYNKGCYIGQEIIARIHFRGHVAKRLTGLVLEPPAATAGIAPGTELTNADGKNAGRITSVTFSPKLDKTIALAFVRYDYLAAGTQLFAGKERSIVMELPFVE
jgi:folate-binding protein YgfZ